MTHRRAAIVLAAALGAGLVNGCLSEVADSVEECIGYCTDEARVCFADAKACSDECQDPEWCRGCGKLMGDCAVWALECLQDCAGSL